MSVGGAGATSDGHVYLSGGLGVGVTTSTAGALETSGKAYFGGSNLTLAGSGTSTFPGSLLISTSAGNVGIGTSTPIVFLSVGGAAGTSDGNAFFSGGVGVGDATTTSGALSVSGNSRVSGNLQIGNSGTAISQVLFSGTCTVDPPSLHAGGLGHAQCTDATGVAVADIVFLSTELPAAWNEGIDIRSASSTAADTINFVFSNTSTTTVIDIGSVLIPWFAIQ